MHKIGYVVVQCPKCDHAQRELESEIMESTVCYECGYTFTPAASKNIRHVKKSTQPKKTTLPTLPPVIREDDTPILVPQHPKNNLWPYILALLFLVGAVIYYRYEKVDRLAQARAREVLALMNFDVEEKAQYTAEIEYNRIIAGRGDVPEKTRRGLYEAVYRECLKGWQNKKYYIERVIYLASARTDSVNDTLLVVKGALDKYRDSSRNFALWDRSHLEDMAEKTVQVGIDMLEAGKMVE